MGLAAEIAYAELVARAAASLAERPGRRIDPDDLQRAAVAVLMVDRGGVCRVPLIVRGNDAPVHGGQIALLRRIVGRPGVIRPPTPRRASIPG